MDELFASAASAAPSSSAAPPLALPPLAASDRVAVARFSRTGASSPWNAPVFYRGAAAAEGSSTREVPGRLRVDHEVNQPQAKLQEARETFDPMAEEALYVAYRVAGAEGKPLGLAHVRELGETTQRVTGRQRKYSGSSQVVHSAESPAGALPLLFALDDEMHMFGGGPAHTSVWAKLTAALRPFRADDAAGADTAGAGASASEDRLLPHAARLHHSKPRSTRVSWSTYPDLASATSYGRSFYRHSDEEHPELLFAQAVDEANGLVVRKLLTHPKAGGELFVKARRLSRCCAGCLLPLLCCCAALRCVRPRQPAAPPLACPPARRRWRATGPLGSSTPASRASATLTSTRASPTGCATTAPTSSTPPGSGCAPGGAPLCRAAPCRCHFLCCADAPPFLR